MSSYSILFSAVVSSTASTGSAGDVLIPDATTGQYVKATTANRGTRRATGIALSSYVAGGVVDIQQTGCVPTTVTGFAAGAASWVRCSATGTLEKVTPGAGDDLLGKVDTDGRFFLDPGKWDSTNYAGGGGGSFTAPTGTGFATTTAGALDAASLAFPLADTKGGTGLSALGAGVATFLGAPSSANLLAALTTSTGTGSAAFHNSPSLTTPRIYASGGVFKYLVAASALAADRSVTLPLLTGNDVFVFADFAQTLTNKTISGASNTITNVAIGSAVSGLGTGVATFLGTPSGANLAAALTSALPVTKGGTGLTALTIPASALLVGTTDTQTLSGKTLTDPIVNVTAIDNATAGGTINDCTLAGTAGTSRRVRFTDASGPTITGFDATGVAQGTILYVYAATGSLAITSEGAGSAAANRCTLQGGTTVNPAIGTVTSFMYLSDGANSRWRHFAGTAI